LKRGKKEKKNFNENKITVDEECEACGIEREKTQHYE